MRLKICNVSYQKKAFPRDNACIESFRSIIKREWLNRFKIDGTFLCIFKTLNADAKMRRLPVDALMTEALPPIYCQAQKLRAAIILADKAYGSHQIRDYIMEKNACYTIEPNENCVDPWPCEYVTCKESHIIECFFRKIKAFCRV